MKRKSSIFAVALAVAAISPAAATAQSQLGWNQAHRAATNVGWGFPVPGGGAESVKTFFCDRFSRWQIDCGVEADGTVETWDDCHDISYSGDCIGGYDSQDSWCMATVDVFKNRRTGRVWARREADTMDCFGG